MHDELMWLGELPDNSGMLIRKQKTLVAFNAETG
jgi:hypothetical protein